MNKDQTSSGKMSKNWLLVRVICRLCSLIVFWWLRTFFTNFGGVLFGQYGTFFIAKRRKVETKTTWFLGVLARGSHLLNIEKDWQFSWSHYTLFEAQVIKHIMNHFMKETVLSNLSDFIPSVWKAISFFLAPPKKFINHDYKCCFIPALVIFYVCGLL